MSDNSVVGTGIKIANYLMAMRKRDLLLLSLICTTVFAFGVLTGYVPSPLLIAMAQHAQILENDKNEVKLSTDLLEISRLQLYLQRENCMHGAHTESEKSRCDRQSIRDAILGDILPLAENVAN